MWDSWFFLGQSPPVLALGFVAPPICLVWGGTWSEGSTYYWEDIGLAHRGLFDWLFLYFLLSKD